MKLCPQCNHPEHLPIKEDGTEGCPIVVYFQPKTDENYHEHCDCDYGYTDDQNNAETQNNAEAHKMEVLL